MKVYSEIIINKQGCVISEKSFEYAGETCQCKGGKTVVQPPPEPTEAELAIQEEILAQMREGAPTEEERQLQTEATRLQTEFLEAQVEGLPAQQELQELQIEAARQQFGAQERLLPLQEQILTQQAQTVTEQLVNLSQARELGEITGDLSQEELDFFDELETNAIDRLTETVNEERVDVMQANIANLVDRGVLQGEIGSRIISKIDEKALKFVAEGTREISTQKLGQILARQEANRQFGFQQQALVQQGLLGLSTAQQNITSGVALPAIQFGQQAGASFGQALDIGGQLAGIGAQRGIAGLQAGGGVLAQLAGSRQAQAERALQGSIASSQSRAATTASLYGAGGAAAAGIAIGI